MTSEKASRNDERTDIIHRVLATTMAVAPEARGSTLVIITEAQGDWNRSAAISGDAERWHQNQGLDPFFRDVFHVQKDPLHIGVTQTNENKHQMVTEMTAVLKPENAGLCFHEKMMSPDPSKTWSELCKLLEKQMRLFLRKKLDDTKSKTPGRRAPIVYYTGKDSGPDDLMMVLLMAVHESLVFLERSHLGLNGRQ